MGAEFDKIESNWSSDRGARSRAAPSVAFGATSPADAGEGVDCEAYKLDTLSRGAGEVARVA